MVATEWGIRRGGREILIFKLRKVNYPKGVSYTNLKGIVRILRTLKNSRFLTSSTFNKICSEN